MRSVPTQVGVLPGALLLPTAALADPMDWEKLADDPESFIGKPVEVLSYCAEGGVKGDLDGYQCATEGDLYISTPEIKPDFAIRKIEENCGDPDVVKAERILPRQNYLRPAIRLEWRFRWAV
jgi:hypothetical protein